MKFFWNTKRKELTDPRKEIDDLRFQISKFLGLNVTEVGEDIYRVTCENTVLCIGNIRSVYWFFKGILLGREIKVNRVKGGIE